MDHDWGLPAELGDSVETGGGQGPAGERRGRANGRAPAYRGSSPRTMDSKMVSMADAEIVRLQQEEGLAYVQ
jgi:hypothetical protein